MVFALWDRAKLAADSARATDGGGWGGVTLAYLVGSPEEVDEVLAARAGGRRQRPARRAARPPWGGYSGIFVDPEGHPWEVAHNPGWTLRRRTARSSLQRLTAESASRSTPRRWRSRSSAQLLMQ